jgi:hypothetical protein
MARIRTIKPQFWDDAKIGRIPRDARLLYIGLWTFADDLGVVIADPVWLKSKIFPYDRIQIQQLEAWLGLLEETGFISLLSVKSESFYYLPTFSRHQIINRPNLDDVNIDKKLLDNILAKFSDQSVINHGSISDQSVINHGSISDQSVTIIGEEKDRDSSTPYNPPKGEIGSPDSDDESVENGPEKKKSCGKRKETDLSFVEPSFQPVMAEWLAYKSERGQSYRQQGLKACYSKLRELSNGDPDIARKIIRQSMANNWAGLFPLKTTNDYGRSTKNQPPGPDELARAVAEGISRAHTRQEWE